MNRWIDISVPLHNGMATWPGDQVFQMRRDRSMNQGDELNLSQITASVHTGTHMDAPVHFVKDGASIDQIPLDAVMGLARVIAIANPHEIPVNELEAANIVAGERILFKTANSERAWKTNEFQKDFIAIPEDSAKFLAERKPVLVGVDYLSIGPFSDGGPTHRAMLGAGIWVVEGLKLHGIEPGEYELACLPLKLVGSDGAPARAVIRKI
jgi:arylformamidase